MSSQTDRKPWGSAPPYITMAEAFVLATRFYEQSAGQGSFDVLSRIVGNSTSSSSFTRKLAALKLYGLVDEPSKGNVVLTSIGSTIAAPTSAEGGALAKREAFLRVRPFSQIHERHKGKLLPADEFLKNMLEQECAVSREVSSGWLEAFKEGIREAGLLHDRGDGKLQIMDLPAVRGRVASPPPAAQVEEPVAPPTPAPGSGSSNGRGHVGGDDGMTGHTTRIELAGGRHATFSIPDRLTANDVRKLKQVLVGLGAIIESGVTEEEEGKQP